MVLVSTDFTPEIVIPVSGSTARVMVLVCRLAPTAAVLLVDSSAVLNMVLAVTISGSGLDLCSKQRVINILYVCL